MKLKNRFHNDWSATRRDKTQLHLLVDRHAQWCVAVEKVPVFGTGHIGVRTQ